MKEETSNLTPFYGKYLVRLTRPFPNFDFSFIKPVRQKAVELLNLKHGDSVLDVGCGPGGSFPFLVGAVGESGSVVGVEISPEHSESARNRIKSNGWNNVEVIVSPAESVKLSGLYNGLLMFAAPDVYASPAALDNIVPTLVQGARVVAFGGKLSTRGFGKILNPILRQLYKLSFSTTPKPSYKSWEILASYLGDDLVVEEYFLGLMFVVSGTLQRKDENVPGTKQ